MLFALVDVSVLADLSGVTASRELRIVTFVTQLLRFFLPRDQLDSDSLRYLSYLPDSLSLSISIAALACPV